MAATSIKTYLDPELARDVARIARAQGRSESSVIVEAVRARLGADSDGVLGAKRDTQRRQLNRLEARLDKLVRDQALMKECVLLFVRVWLEHNPPIDEEHADSAAASAEGRFERFLDLLMKGLTPGHSIANGAFLDDIETDEANNSEAGAEA